ncbi:acetyl-coA hydrolase [Cavenderia fasciculata]|uniref:Acetyl-CoA hydrolase n=1 Tax=Cavenderia fasciculata TaxID=261658 RepID=F4Q3N1_CACFS|nr:acetyl-coA hydrolase [Cavenderia fasciculata]EGG17689.1 acetyl-coA hydrolase [Cavenderia fasciculata]|eukprot:XP_004356173.1 acetyl-coA hydrolase [Cavenderia fasciculata]
MKSSKVADTLLNTVIKDRIKRPSLLNKICDPQSLINHFQNGMYLGWSGFAGTGYPKMMPIALADHVEKNQLQGKMKYNLFVGASTGAETEDRWAGLDMIDRRYPHQVGRNLRKGINSDKIRFSDEHLSIFANELQYGYYTMNKEGNKRKLDIAIVEATEITEDGDIVPGASVGILPEILQMADKVIIELNTSLPSLRGLHDMVSIPLPPHTKPFPLSRVDDRIGVDAFPCNPDKIIGIVESQAPDATTDNDPEDEVSNAIAQHIVRFLEREVGAGRLPPSLLPLQSGIGSIANAVIGGISRSPFENITVWTEVLQDTFLDFFDNGKLKFASATSLRFSPAGFNRLFSNWPNYRDKLVLRNQSISNGAELVRRLGVIALNTPVEFDIYGHVNSTCVQGSKMLNGVGGSGDFLRNSKLSIVHAPSTRPTKTDEHGITSIVPFCSHIDHPEHDIDVVVTEQGLADLRGLCPRDRARTIIEKCSHPLYKPLLLDYYERAHTKGLKTFSSHEPHMLDKAFKMYQNLEEKGTMRISSWD